MSTVRPSKSSHGRPFSANRTNPDAVPKTASDGRQYPEIRQRGFYSDILPKGSKNRVGQVQQGPQISQDVLWNVAKEKHTPKVTTFVGPKDGGITESEGEYSSGSSPVSDFPDKAYQPKVQLPYFTPPGQCPRKIETERRKRHYAQQDLVQLLQQRGIQTAQLMPKNQPNGIKSIKLNDPNEPAPFPPYLPLEVFDNTEKDVRRPDEWISLGQDNGVRKPVPAKALLPTRDDVHHLDPKDPSIEYKWFDVGVLDYDIKSEKYFIQKINTKGRIIDKHAKPVVNGGILKDGARMSLQSQYWVPRVRLMFSAEDPEVFVDRIAEAYQSRKQTEALLRYNLYIDCMPMEGVGELDQASLRRMTEWAKGAPALSRDKSLDDYMQVLEKEVNIDFCRSMNRIIFDKTVQDDPQTFAFVTVPPKKPADVPSKGCSLDVPDYPFDEQYDSFAFNSLLTREEAISAISKVGSECNEVAGKSLFHVPTTKHMRLEEFEQTQSQATSQVALFLKDSWITTLRAAIRTSLRDVGKGWFNLHETNWEVYQMSKKKKVPTATLR